MARPMGAWSDSAFPGQFRLDELAADKGRPASAAQHTNVGKSFLVYFGKAFTSKEWARVATTK